MSEVNTKDLIVLNKFLVIQIILIGIVIGVNMTAIYFDSSRLNYTTIAQAGACIYLSLFISLQTPVEQWGKRKAYKSNEPIYIVKKDAHHGLILLSIFFGMLLMICINKIIFGGGIDAGIGVIGFAIVAIIYRIIIQLKTIKSQDEKYKKRVALTLLNMQNTKNKSKRITS